MSRLYERFVLEYFRREHGCELNVGAPYVPWALDDAHDGLLPTMRTDITLEGRSGVERHVLIIDTKYYSHALQFRFDGKTVHSGHLYQIFAYVKNADENLRRRTIPHKVSGMLLYARTDEELVPNESYRMSGNDVHVRLLDLNLPFSELRAQLDAIAEEV